MEEDITDIVQQYRLALSYLWNHHFWATSAMREWESVEVFEQIKVPLFEALVARRVERDSGGRTMIFGDGYKIVPKKEPSGKEGVITSLFVDIGFKSSPGQCWKELTGRFSATDIAMTLLDLFEWDKLNWKDFRYYYVRLDSFREYPDLVGRNGLVDVLRADVVFEPRTPD